MARKVSARHKDYRIGLDWDGETGAGVHIDNRHELKVDMPKDFGGKGRFPCPHELLFSSFGGCILVTYLKMARDMNLDLKGLKVSVYGRVDWTDYSIADVEVTISPEIREDEVWEADECARLAEKYCPMKRELAPALSVRIATEVRIHKESSS
jgi:uncharacterized OsmC-like protein